MKIVMTRNRHLYGGIHRQFREMARYCTDVIDFYGVLPLADRTERIALPAPTFAYGASLLRGEPGSAGSLAELLDCCEPLIAAIAEDLHRLLPDGCLAVDTSLRTLCFLEAADRVGLGTVTLAQGVAPIEGRPIDAVTRWAAQFCLSRTNRVVFPSSLAAASSAAHFPTMAPHLVIPNGVPPTFVQLPPPPPPPLRMGGVMRMASEKNPAPFLAAGRRLEAMGWETVLTTDVCDIDEDLKQLDFSGVRIRPPSTDDEALLTFYRSCRLIAGTSRFETYGNVALEALALGVPVAVTTGMGVSEVFAELGLDDWVLPVDDIEALVECALHVRPLPAEVRARVGREYNWGRTFERLVALAVEVGRS